MTRSNPGVHSIQLGEITVTALADGQFEGSIDIVVGASGPQVESLLRDSFRALPPVLSCSCFLLEWPDRRVVLDFGAGTAFGATMGKAHQRLATLDVAPDAIDAVLLTHGHPDHLGGLLNAEKGAFFPRASLHASETEIAFWSDPAMEGPYPELARTVLSAYAPRLQPFAGAATVMPGVTAVPLPGHTPGHTGFMIASGSDRLFVFADTIHLPGVQFAMPSAGVAFDADGAAAVASRARALDMAASDRLLVAGIHLDFPVFGHVARHGDAYAFEPAVWMQTAAGIGG